MPPSTATDIAADTISRALSLSPGCRAVTELVAVLSAALRAAATGAGARSSHMLLLNNHELQPLTHAAAQLPADVIAAARAAAISREPLTAKTSLGNALLAAAGDAYETAILLVLIEPSAAAAEGAQWLHLASRWISTAIRCAIRTEELDAGHMPLCRGPVGPERFMAAYHAEVTRCRRYNHPLSVAVLRIGQLDGADATATTDAVRAVANLIAASVRATDIVTRLAPDKVAILLPETDLEGALIVLDRTASHVGSMGLRNPVSGVPLTFTGNVASTNHGGGGDLLTVAANPSDRQRLATLHQSLDALSQLHNADQLIDAVMHVLTRLIGAEQVAIFMVDHDKQEICLFRTMGPENDGTPCVPLTATIAGQVALTNTLRNVSRAQAEAMIGTREATLAGPVPENVLAAPITDEHGTVFAVVEILNKPAGFDPIDELLALTFATKVGPAVKRAKARPPASP